jgi:hypothetical protein
VKGRLELLYSVEIESASGRETDIKRGERKTTTPPPVEDSEPRSIQPRRRNTRKMPVVVGARERGRRDFGYNGERKREVSQTKRAINRHDHHHHHIRCFRGGSGDLREGFSTKHGFVRNPNQPIQQPQEQQQARQRGRESLIAGIVDCEQT